MNQTEMENDYSDIIGMPHHVSANRPRMPLQLRAAQFAPFAALSRGPETKSPGSGRDPGQRSK